MMTRKLWQMITVSAESIFPCICFSHCASLSYLCVHQGGTQLCAKQRTEVGGHNPPNVMVVGTLLALTECKADHQHSLNSWSWHAYTLTLMTLSTLRSSRDGYRDILKRKHKQNTNCEWRILRWTDFTLKFKNKPHQTTNHRRNLIWTICQPCVWNNIVYSHCREQVFDVKGKLVLMVTMRNKPTWHQPRMMKKCMVGLIFSLLSNKIDQIQLCIGWCWGWILRYNPHFKSD